MTKIMRTLRDIHNEISSELLSPQSFLSNGYTAGDITDLEERIDSKLSEKEIEKVTEKPIQEVKKKKKGTKK